MSSRAVDVALIYYNAWVAGRVSEAIGYLAPTFHADAPRAGHVTSKDEWEKILVEYVGILDGSKPLCAHGDDDSALLLYEQDTKLAGAAATAEYIVLRDGKIEYIKVIFDRTPFENARRELASRNEAKGGQ